MSRNINELKAGVFLNYVLIVVNALVGLLYTPYMLRTMGQSEYGLYSLVASVIAYLTILDLGFGNAIVRYTAKFRAEGKVKEQFEMLGMFFLLYLIISVIASVIGFVLYLNVDNMFGDTMTTVELEHARIMMIVLIINLAFTFPLSVFTSVNTAYEKFVFPRVLNIARVIFNTIVMIVLLHLGFRAIAMVVVQTIFNLLTLLLNYIYCKHRLRVKLLFTHFDWHLLKEIGFYSLWIFIAAIVDRIDLSTGQFVLGAVSGTAEVAVFAVVITLRGMYTQFSTAVSSVFLPKMTTMVAESKSDSELSDVFLRTSRIQYIILSFILTGYVIFGLEFMTLWAGKEYIISYYIGLLLFIPDTIPLCQNIGIAIMQARNQMRFRAVSYLIIAIFSLLLQILLGKMYGSLGCAIAMACATTTGRIFVMNTYYYRIQKIDIPAFWREISKMSIVPALFCLILLSFRGFYPLANSWSMLLIEMIVFSLLYIVLVYKYQFNEGERILIKNVVENIKKIRANGRGIKKTY